MGLLDEFAKVVKDVLEICRKANAIFNEVKTMTNGSQETLKNLTVEAASIVRIEASDFREALRSANALGAAMLNRYGMLEKEFFEFLNFTKKISAEGQVIGRVDIDNCKRIAESILQCAKNCIDNFSEFHEKMLKAVELGALLAERCRIAGQSAEQSALNHRTVGHVTTGLTGTGAVGTTLALTLGFLSLSGAAAVTLGAAGTVYCCSMAKKLDDLASELKNLRGKLDADIKNLNTLADKIEGKDQIARRIVEELKKELDLATEEMKAKEGARN